MPPTASYHPQTAEAAYQVRHSWTGWPATGRFTHQPSNLIDDTAPLWESGQRRIWDDGFYVGTFGEYTTHAVRDVAHGKK